jgi:hypothetical protein
MLEVLSVEAESGFSLWHIIKKYFYYIIVLIILLPVIISSISTAINTQNYSYPFFQLGTKILASDNSLYNNVELLKTDITKLIGMANPDSGAWLHVVFYWKFFWNVIFNIFSDLWLILLPFMVIYTIVNLFNKNTNSPMSIFFTSLIIFLAYMFITNTVIFIYDLVNGNITYILPPSTNQFSAYFLIIQRLIPFHGVASFVVFLFSFF